MQVVAKSSQPVFRTSSRRLVNTGIFRELSTTAKGKQPIRAKDIWASSSESVPEIGCSSWTPSFQYRYYASKSSGGDGDVEGQSTPSIPTTSTAGVPKDEAGISSEELFDFVEEDDLEEDYELDEDSFTIEHVDSEGSIDGKATPIDSTPRPKLPRSIKKLNKLLSRHNTIEIPEHELQEMFVRGSGPGGQAINKTNSSVSLLHIPTGIRVQAQPTRLREQNRKAARHILRDKLDDLRAQGLYTPSKLPSSTAAPDENSAGDSQLVHKVKKKQALNEIAAAYSKYELRAAKEQSRKADRAKKHRRKKRKMEEEAAATAANEHSAPAGDPSA